MIKDQKFGVSFSIKCQDEFNGKQQDCLKQALSDLGVRRLRLMSYWDEHEKVQGVYDFSELDWQIELAEKYNAEVTFCLGIKQPRWPESHIPKWAKDLNDAAIEQSLFAYIKVVMKRYKNRDCIVSWQLENEARLKSFGGEGNFNRSRLQREFMLVKSIDPVRPIIMSTSDSFGIPFRKPNADIYGFSVYRYFYRRNQYKHAARPPLFYKLRAAIITSLRNRPCYIHELQCEPWGSSSNVTMPAKEQDKSISLKRFAENIEYAKKTNLYPIDLWGLEYWWYRKNTMNDDSFWNYAKQNIFTKRT
jgi:hypothetical protein